MKEIAAGHFLYHCDENDMGGMDDEKEFQKHEKIYDTCCDGRSLSGVRLC